MNEENKNENKEKIIGSYIFIFKVFLKNLEALDTSINPNFFFSYFYHFSVPQKNFLYS